MAIAKLPSTQRWRGQLSISEPVCVSSVPVVSQPFHAHYWGKFITWNVNFFGFFFFLGLRTNYINVKKNFRVLFSNILVV